MKAVVYHDVGDIRLDDVPEPTIQDPNDALVRITGSGVCGTDLHMIRGTLPGMEEGTILGHEAVGIVEETGSNVRNFRQGDRVVIPSTIACGYCSYCRAGYFSQCDNANPNDPHGQLPAPPVHSGADGNRLQRHGPAGAGHHPGTADRLRHRRLPDVRPA